MRRLVVPAERPPAEDISRAAAANSIEILTFTLDRETEAVVLNTHGVSVA